MNVTPEAGEWVRKAEGDLYPGEWSDAAAAAQALTQADKVRALIREKLILLEGNK